MSHDSVQPPLLVYICYCVHPCIIADVYGTMFDITAVTMFDITAVNIWQAELDDLASWPPTSIARFCTS